MSKRSQYYGPALFSAGFRPFFLLAAGFAPVAIGVWLAVWTGRVDLTSVFSPVDWHVHEMIFGYGAAVVAGFLFTAVPNWTGRLPTRGTQLAALSGIWLLGRLACAGFLHIGPVATLAVDQSFLLLVGAMIAREIIAGRNWRNLKVLIPFTLFWAANLAFHLEAMQTGNATFAYRAGIGILVFLIMLIGGRIIPSFTRNWLVKQGQGRLPTPFNRFDAVAILIGVGALLAWTGAVDERIAGLLFALAAIVHAFRLARWRGHATLRSPLLLMLHLSYALIPVGFAFATLSALGLASDATTLHAFAVGAIGTMTVAVMIRATLGHTGRTLEAGFLAMTAFLVLIASMGVRVLAEFSPDTREPLIVLAGVLWVAAFTGVLVRILPLIARPVAARRPSSAH